MKKVLSIAFAITVVCALLMICASAATGSASLSASASEVSRGDTFSVTVSVSGATDVGSIGIMPVYTSAAIECTGGSWLIAGSLSDVSASDAVIAFQPTQDVSGSVLTLNFKVKANAPLGAQTIDAVVIVNNTPVGTSSTSVTVACAHTYEEIVDDTYLKDAATCTEKAVYYKSCSICKAASTTETFSAGELLPHTYDKTVVDEKYLASKATCVAKATYYKSCVCGKAGDLTFESGEALDHDWKTEYETSEAEHWNACSRCSERNNAAGHTYDQQIASQTYLKDEATCTKKATYYKSCVCGKAGSTFFESGATLPHAYKNNVDEAFKVSGASCTAAAVYYKSCSCGAVSTETFTSGEHLGHTGGTATCTEKAICTRCSQPYGDTLPHNFNQQVENDKYKKNDASCTVKKTYYKSCACGETGTTTFTVGELLNHSFSIESVEVRYLKAAATCTSRAVYYKSCICGTTGSATFEVGEAPSHKFAPNWSTDAAAHWYQCTACDEKANYAEHVAGAAATETTAQKCTVCEYIITPALGHTHDYATTWSSDASHHWYACDGCSEFKDKAVHTFDHACDTDCNVCGYTREINHNYKKTISCNAEKHWYECEICASKTEEAAHIPGAEATVASAQTCTVCGYVLAPALEHTHAYDDAWKKDDASHWLECACGEKNELAAHTWNDGVITTEPTTEAEGVKTYTCTVCAAEKAEAIEKLPAEDTSDEITEDTTEAKPDDSQADTTDKIPDDSKADTTDEKTDTEPAKKDNTIVILVGIGIVAVAGIAGLAITFQKKRKI